MNNGCVRYFQFGDVSKAQLKSGIELHMIKSEYPFMVLNLPRNLSGQYMRALQFTKLLDHSILKLNKDVET